MVQWFKEMLRTGGRPLHLILLVAFVMRAANLFWGAPPQISAPDDYEQIEASLKVFAEPSFYHTREYPPAYQRMVSLILTPHALWYHATHPHSAELPAIGHFYAARMHSPVS